MEQQTPSLGRIVHVRDEIGTLHVAIVVNDHPDEDQEIVVFAFARTPDKDEPGYQFVHKNPDTRSGNSYTWEWPRRVP